MMNKKASIKPLNMSDSCPTDVRPMSDCSPRTLGAKPVLKCGWTVLILTLIAFLSGCRPEQTMQQYSFNATMEQLVNADNSKVQLVNEEWTYWESYDSINITSNAAATNKFGNSLYTGWLVDGGGGDFADYNGVFITTLTEKNNETSQWFVGIHPANHQKHEVTYTSGNHGFAAKVYLEPVQHYRHDSSYARQVLPMIATYDGAEWNESNPNPYRLDFHSLAGLVRLQLLNSSSNDVTISKIELTSNDDTPLPLAGLFPVDDLYTFDAHLNTSGASETTRTITLSTSETEATGSLAFARNELKSFYIVLPAFHGMDATTTYHLDMTVYTSEGTFKKSFTANTRRNGITYLRAIKILTFDPDNGNGNGTPVLVGNGNSTRPFKIYSIEDLRYVRDCFQSPDGSGNVYVNGQLVTANTYFRIMRSDITLTPSTWVDGINNFKGHMTYYSNAPHVIHGITNQSYKPLFTSIHADGVVSGISIITNSELDFNTSGSGTDYSPLCGTNYGRIENCRNVSPDNLESEASRFIGKLGGSCYAGICINNMSTGTIVNCDYGAIRVLTNNCDFAGVCKENNGIVQGCAITGPASVEGGGNRGGICLTNNGEVKDCYCNFTYSNFSNGANWGGIVYQNNSGATRLVKNCYVSSSTILRTNGNVGGIVCINNGTVDYCHNESYSLHGRNVGGIVSTLSGGVVSNCYNNDPSLFITLYATAGAHSAGGIAAVQSAGTIRNCFSVMRHIIVNSADATGTYGAVVGRITASAATINNCYAYELDEGIPQFYGSNNNGTLTNCHLLGATQEGVDGITTINNSSLATLLTSLNDNRPDDGLTWTRGLGEDETSDSALPTLVPPASAKHRRHR